MDETRKLRNMNIYIRTLHNFQYENDKKNK